ncbi:MAG: hypothetical protein ACLR23_18035 [Clostridia bacterium]
MKTTKVERANPMVSGIGSLHFMYRFAAAGIVLGSMWWYFLKVSIEVL